MATAPRDILTQALTEYGTLPAFVWLRRPEIGMAMVRARTGGTGTQFNLGEMTVTRCALQLASGEMGIAYVAGRDNQHAELAAICDALMQSDAAPRIEREVLMPIEAALTARSAATIEAANQTRVEFLTMVRGEEA